EREVRELERRAASLERRRVGRIQDEIRRGLVRHRDPVARALAEGAVDLIERQAPDLIVALVERIEIRTAEGDLPGRAGLAALGASDQAQRRAIAERRAKRSGQRGIAELVVRRLVVGREPRGVRGIVEAPGLRGDAAGTADGVERASLEPELSLGRGRSAAPCEQLD